MQDPSVYLSSLRLAHHLVFSSEFNFIAHVYNLLLRREPEFTSDAADGNLLNANDPWDRCAYISKTLQSEEFIHNNPDYDRVLALFFAVLGYKGSRATLARYMQDIYPMKEDFYKNLEDIMANISMNTHRMYFGPPVEQIIDACDLPEIVRVTIASIPVIDARCAKIESDMRDLIWNISDLRSRMSVPSGAGAGNQEIKEFLLAIQAQLQMGVVK